MKKKLNIEGMSCGHCVQSTTDALNQVEQISKVDVNLEEKSAVVELSAAIDDAVLKTTIEDIGFSVTGISDC